MSTEKIDEAVFQREVIKGKKASVVFFYTLWDAGSRTSSPSFERTASDYADEFAFYRYEVNARSDRPGDADIRAFPTVMLFKGGKQVDRIIGAFTSPRLEALIRGA